MNDLLRGCRQRSRWAGVVESIEAGQGKRLGHSSKLSSESKPDGFKDVSIEAQLHKEQLTTQFNGQGKRTVFEANRISVETEAGRLLESRDDPRSAFRGHTRQTPWDDLHLAYFSSYALWNYLTIPFLYTYPGFVTEELVPWQENGERWRPLKATFPDTIASHSSEQVYYFAARRLLRRRAQFPRCDDDPTFHELRLRAVLIAIISPCPHRANEQLLMLCPFRYAPRMRCDIF